MKKPVKHITGNEASALLSCGEGQGGVSNSLSCGEGRGEVCLIRFDWAMKRLLRQKANYVVLEGFLTVVLGEKVKIVSIEDSESNQANAKDKFNRVDIIVKNDIGQILIVELQSSDESDYFLRMLYGVSKAITERMNKGDKYHNVSKVYHINIVYFKLGEGKDYVYKGITEFRGIHLNDVLQLTQEQKDFFVKKKRKNVRDVKDLYPEYYILCVEDFDDVAKSSLDEWIYYLKNDAVLPGSKAPGLKEVQEALVYSKLDGQEKRDYDHYVKQRNYEENAIQTAIFKGEFKARKEMEGVFAEKDQKITELTQHLENERRKSQELQAKLDELNKNHKTLNHKPETQ